MRIRFGEFILNEIDMENEEYKWSNLYDVDLHSFDMSIKVKGSSLDKFKKTLEECSDGGIYKLDENDKEIDEYKVSVNSKSYTGNSTNENTIYNYNLALEQVINRSLESLKIDNLTVTPYEYEEEDNDAIVARAKIKLSKEEMEMFKEIEDGEKYFDVIRYGISDKVVKMRFGENIWSKHDEFFKVSITLVEEIYDKKNNNRSLPLFQPEMNNIMNMLAYERNLNNELLSILLDKNILSKDEVSNLKSKSEKEINESYRSFYKVNDIDDFK